MKITLLQTGKTTNNCIAEIAGNYHSRLVHYAPFKLKTLPDIKNVKNFSEAQIKQKEGELIMRQIEPGDHVILLDEKGKTYTSLKFADHMQSIMNRGLRNLVFVIGGPYGFSKEVYERCNEKLSLSQMTFSHQIIRAIFAEQLYRAFTILKNEPYHHQ